jgi:hypothetical protein
MQDENVPVQQPLFDGTRYLIDQARPLILWRAET